MKRSEKVILSVAVVAVGGTAAWFVNAARVQGKRDAAMARLLAPPRTQAGIPLDAAPDVLPHERALTEARRGAGAYDFRDLLREHRGMVRDWELKYFVRAWSRDATAFTDADWLEAERLVMQYQEALKATAEAVEQQAPMIGLEPDDQLTLSLIGHLMLIEAELSFRNGDDEKGLQRLVTAPLVFAAACDLLNRVLPNPVPHRYIEPLLERLTEFDPRKNELNRIVRFAQRRTDEWDERYDMSGWFQTPLQRGHRFLERLYIEGPTRALYGSPLGHPMVDGDVAKFLELQSRLRDALLLPYADALSAAETIDRDAASWSSEPFRLVREDAVRAAGRIETIARETARLELPQLGMLIERYHADHRAFPASLDVIADRLPDGLPADPFTGEDYIYRITGDGFVLYSTGPNQIDDNANPNEGLDLVWRVGSGHTTP